MQQDTGSVHGRFQVFHNDHLLYCLRVLELHEVVCIGLTNCKGLAGSEVPMGRTLDSENPFSFIDRVTMISQALNVHGIDSSRFWFTPCPLEMPDLLGYYFPKDAPAYCTIREEWNRTKIEILRGQGYDVRVLFEDLDKRVRGTDIRRLIREGDESWRELVPEGSQLFLEGVNWLKPLEK